MTDNNITYVEASCHCELNCFTVGFETAKLPLSTDLCHCNTCRHATGQMAVEQVSFEGVPMKSAHPGSRRRARSANASRSRSPSPNPLSRQNNHTINGTSTTGGRLAVPTTVVPVAEEDARQPFELSDLDAYESSKKATRYFCRSCSAHLFWVHHVDGEPDRWSVSVGALDEIEGIVQCKNHIWVGDTVDGGLADHILSINGVELPRYKEEEVDGEQLPLGWKDSDVVKQAAKNTELQAYCHCGAFKFSVSRPSEQSLDPTLAYPDLLCAYDMTRLSKLNNSKDDKWWLQAGNTKYLAGHCMCTFCRLASGFEIQSWGFIPLCNITDGGSGNPLCLEKAESRPKGLKQYISSPGMYREFCGTCGASAFFWEAGVPDLVYVSMGLFDEKSAGGARAESWFEWHKDRVSFCEKAINHDLAKALSEGLKGSKGTNSN